ncbi:FabD/lysophospholipase-like protein [Corynespora cassiicola Philippines]|uniref:FabD/lysophospholipase-like protein n=1 Tax=Corynespora cassiicola Philippines TaxID=1448308 RepID=A0A2T2N614_CORCC|nr:FabD/lysophospholipase-like protein [Corynespora cassiicola Philippines]
MSSVILYTLLSAVKQHADFVSARASANINKLNVITKIYHANINVFYRDVGGAQNFINHSTCFCCLADLAEHPLPCGYILCTRCIKGFSTVSKTVSGVYFVSSCPLHHRVSFKPKLAGVRVLSLNSGGIRGIVILEVLRKLQEELGNSILILDFFDLVVGTSTGGILALGLGLKNWSVDHCTKMFLNMVDRAFTPKIWGLGGVKFGTTKYRTQPLQDALRDTFKEEMIFGSKFETPRSGRKVAVTSSNDTGGQAVIFTNYNQAASNQATSAASTYFKPFVNSRTKEGYLDRAVFHNNSVWIANYKSKLLWPNSEDFHPDILLLIGTGHHSVDTNSYLDPSRDGRGSQIRRKKFRKDIVGNSCNITAARYIRINPETKLFHDLQDEVRSKLRTYRMSVEIKTIAHRLVASSFYFEKSGPLREAGDRITIQGNVRCCFNAGSTNLRNLGRYIQGLQTLIFQPYLIVREVNYDGNAHKIYITDEVILDMVHRGSFQLESIAITATSQSALLSIDLHLIGDKNQQHQYSSTPISGFLRGFSEKKGL